MPDVTTGFAAAVRSCSGGQRHPGVFAAAVRAGATNVRFRALWHSDPPMGSECQLNAKRLRRAPNQSRCPLSRWVGEKNRVSELKCRGSPDYS